MTANNQILKNSRDQFGLMSLYQSDISQARRIAAQSNVSSTDFFALGLMDYSLRSLMAYFMHQHPKLYENAFDFLEGFIKSRKINHVLLKLIKKYPPEPVYWGHIKPRKYLHRFPTSVMQELLLINFHNNNPAASRLNIHFYDKSIESSAYKDIIKHMESFFHQRTDLAQNDSLWDILNAPFRSSPESLVSQVEYTFQKWSPILGNEFENHLSRDLRILHQEKLRFGTGGTGSRASVLIFDNLQETGLLSSDKEWMKRCVLIAKNVYVWLAQLSNQYGRDILYLNDVPDEELERLAGCGFTGLWLVGLWERSRASQRIKQLTGNEDAVASAYSIDTYDIAESLGGWPALDDLRKRALERGIRLSADMVPNHMGLDSQWVIEAPERFLSVSTSPYPGYSFTSEDLSPQPNIGIYIEDHYYDHSDTAVVFKRIDRDTADERYIYHGNDGTSMPWNDTAQLDYTKSEVREAIIQIILDVAKNFPIIRFDAAMTLVKEHIQRLWHPAPEHEGSIPSRRDFGMSPAEFEQAIPVEFWIEVVKRVSKEAPDTLLLAEAFWLMEGFFVHNLGMHRVYNSSFMHMLRDEDNQNFRQLVKNALANDPQVLERFVNYMTNPDEKPAIEQFGMKDKYFGACTLLATLPGLPMFGHGQIEGLGEKYGMDFKAPKMDEKIDQEFLSMHEKVIFPLLNRRENFVDSEHFLLYDFELLTGKVDENVFCYSNIYEDNQQKKIERSLVVYNNQLGDISGSIKICAPTKDRGSNKLQQRNIAEGLKLPREGYVIFKDYITHLQFIRSCVDIWQKGLLFELSSYQHYAFLDFYFVDGDNWKNRHDLLKGAGTRSLLKQA